ncbi:MAG: hypothetical protein A2086_14160 [Spirochaetes bacterium GWD1_27_9]|nr:MAG: hypothetical protein A2Z98_14645 [Spirochaetes bacterium GWB1_27_13]OHD25715.1 MAG: hypothetical protein A2Y34_13090 [Spirochaetes bacterium GWC1_27_15]OHD29962.1 MAG: hypothetical protein A2086_14160 [Spirochaetes bacterium GWD1_27_9]
MQNIKEYCNFLGSTNPTPGGGSACGLTLAMAASCAEKAGRFSLNDYLSEFITSFLEIKDAGFRLSDEDQDAFKKWGEARKLPKTTIEEKQIRDEKVNFYAKECTRVPYEIAKNSLKLAEIIQDFIPHCNKWLISDIGVAAALASASFDGGIFNILTNFPFLRDEEFKKELNLFLDESVLYFNKMKENIYNLTKTRLNS